MDPDEARISVELHENDPDNFDSDTRSDEVEDPEYGGIEIGGAITRRRCFTLHARCLFERTREELVTVRQIVSAVRDRIENTLLACSFASIRVGTEYVSRGVLSQGLKGRMLQRGGPPDAYDYQILIHFEVLTTKTGV
jgi:hypothetical protein